MEESVMRGDAGEGGGDMRALAVETLAEREHLPERVVRARIEETARRRNLHFLDAAAVLFERRETGFEARHGH
jgi:hypothetical protein